MKNQTDRLEEVMERISPRPQVGRTHKADQISLIHRGKGRSHRNFPVMTEAEEIADRGLTIGTEEDTLHLEAIQR